MSASGNQPDLPVPQKARWQPLRMGLVELYHYDCEEFWFHDGHLLLRGNNGTGKSKVLSLTLPFLLDAQQGGSRVEPDADRSKRMEWNLLMGSYERRTGYAWIEFGRRDEEGVPHYLTLGCGLAAVAGRSRVETWHFLTDQRLGRDLWLLTSERVVLSRDRLAEGLAGHGQVFESAADYRRAVDERLFRFGEERYRALMDTLIQLRQPQLSRQPNEDRLSDALTDALPPLPQATLSDVAEAMNQLESYRRELAELDALREAIGRFTARYRDYARVQARRQARGLRRAQTEFDTASRRLNEACADRDAARSELAEAQEGQAALQIKLSSDQAALDELKLQPVMRDAHRLHEAERTAAARARDAEQSVRQLESNRRRAEEEVACTGERREEAALAARQVAEGKKLAQDRAAQSGMVAEHTALIREGAGAFAAAWSRIVARRREQIALIRIKLGALETAAGERDRAEEGRKARAEALAQAVDMVHEAAQGQADAAEASLLAWAGFVQREGSLLGDTNVAQQELVAWVESLSGPNPMTLALAVAVQTHLRELAAAEARVEQQREEVAQESDKLKTEQAQLERGESRLPPAPHTRDPAARTGLAGGALWQLVEFADHLTDEQQAGLEAALEAAGLLDAWVTPQGALLDANRHDTLLVPRPAASNVSDSASLAAWLQPAQGVLPPRVIEPILRSVACAEQDVPQAEAWVSVTGRYRIGPVTGAWSKPAAQYIGYAAREAARRARLVEIDALLQGLHERQETLRAELAAIAQRRQTIDEAARHAPGDQELIRAHEQFSAAERQRREAQVRTAEADVRLNIAQRAWQQRRDELSRDAADLYLPAEAPGLATVEAALQEYATAAMQLVHWLRESERAERDLSVQKRRSDEAQAEAGRSREDHAQRALQAEEAAARHEALRQAVGAAVGELEQQLAAREAAVRDGKEKATQAQQAIVDANGRAKAGEQKAEEAQRALAERQLKRQEVVAALRAFARTGLLSMAVDNLDMPDPAGDWTVDPALQLARRLEQALLEVPAEDSDWERIRADLPERYTQLTQAVSQRDYQAVAEDSDFGLIVQIIFQNRPERPDLLERRLVAESTQRREVLTAREREVLENYLQEEVAAGLQQLIQDAERRLQSINAELMKRPTSTGVRFKLEWQPLPEGEGGAPVGLAAARTRLLNRSPEAWSIEDRRVVGEFLQNRILGERLREESGSLLDQLSRALDYRRWHRFRVRRYQNGAWRSLSGPASSGERALGLTVPLFAAASSHYESGEYPYAPRLVLLDEAFAGIDDEARAHCMALIREFDLDFVMTSEREWGCYAELPGLAISHLVRREGVDAVYVSRWTWDGRVRREAPDPMRRIPQADSAL